MKRTLVVAILACLTLAPAGVRAGGLEHPDNGTVAVGRGGAFTAKADDLTAIQHNPAALIKSKSRFAVLVNDNLVLPRVRFDRIAWDYGTHDWFDFATAGVPNPVREGSGWFPLGLMGVVGSDLWTDDFMFAFGVYGPSGVGASDFPVDGAQKYVQVDRDILMTYYTLSAAWGITPNLSLGVSLQWVDLPKLKYSVVIDGYFEQSYHPFRSNYDVLATIDATDRFNVTAILGLWYRPHPAVELGLSGRVIPIWFKAKGKVSLEMLGLQVKPPDDCATTPGCHSYDLLKDGKPGANGMTLSFVLPPNLRAGARYVHKRGDREVFDVELDVVYEFWRMLDAFDVQLDADQIRNYIKGGLTTSPLRDIRMVRSFKDSISVRMGGDYNVIPDWLTVRAGLFYESPSARPEYTGIDFVPFHRIGIGTGFTFKYKGFAFSAAYEHIFQPDWIVNDERGSKLLQQRPAGQCEAEGKCDENYVDSAGNQLPAPPVNTGVYSSSIDIVSLGATYRF